MLGRRRDRGEGTAASEGEGSVAAPDEPVAPAAPPGEVKRPPLPLPWPPVLNGVHGFSLRPWGSQPDDAHALVAAWADPEIARWTKVPPHPDLATAQAWISGEEERRERGIALDLVVASLDDPDQVLGEVGFVLVEPARLWAEVGYWLAPHARGRHLAVHALQAFTEFALADLPIQKLFARTHPGNPVSAAVARGAGYDAAGTMEDGTQVWSRDAHEP